MKSARWLALALLVGCAARSSGKAHVNTATATTAQPTAPSAASAEPATSDAAVAKTLASDGYLGVVDRAGLVAIVEQGLGRMLARLKLSPVMEGNRFRGFRVSALDPQWIDCGLQVGDVLLRLNAQPIERPEQAMVAFESLRVASEIAVELQRAGEKQVLRYRVE